MRALAHLRGQGCSRWDMSTVLSRRTTHLVEPALRAPFLVSDHIYIGGLPSITSELDVFELIVFALGKPPNKIILRHNSPGATKHAFVWTSSEFEATRCIQALHKYTYGKRKLMVMNMISNIYTIKHSF